MVIFPIVATVLAFGCAAAVVRDYLARPRPAGLVWSIAFAIFGVAALCEVIGALSGWTPLLARVYYVLGATLVVGYLAVGELYLLMRRSWADKAAGVMILLTALAVSLISKTPIGPDVADEGWRALEPGAGLTALTIGINSTGTAILAGGLLYSVVTFQRKGIMRNRMIGCLLIAAGTLAVASGGTLTRLGSDQYLYIAMSIGIALIFAGYLWTRKPDVAPTTAPTPAPAAARATPAITFHASGIDRPATNGASGGEVVTLRLTLARSADGAWRLLSGAVEGSEPAPLRRGEVALRPVVAGDVATFYEHQRDPEATRMVGLPARDRESFDARWQRILADDGIDKRAIVVDGAVAGNVVSFDVLGERHVGYWLGRDYWGRGIATSALAAFLAEVPSRPLYASVAACNSASRRVLEKCGFTLVPSEDGEDGGDEVLYELRDEG